ncbi:TonB-dependent receptor [Afipia sp. P52-10]|uniref:TonB-dependent receptor n=1 Tax=Afipia sp. P52-10 TaxID=1429916 RepID=UPI0004AF168C|nr:TonB-dependent receptor [Afipia sp. P52-10]
MALLVGAAAPAVAQDTLPEIVVETATPVISGDPDFTSVSTMGQSEVLAHGAASLGDTLGTQAGISQTSFSPVASRPVIRGLGGFRVRTQENGISTQDMANLGEDHAVTIDPLLAGQVEVIRGPGTLRYGSQAIGGVVSATNSRIPDQIPTNGISFASRGGFSSVNNGRDSAALLEAGGNGFAVHVDGFARRAGDYAIPGGGRQLNSGYRSDGYAFGASHIFDRGFVGIAYQHTQMTYYIPGIASAASKNHIDLWQSKWTSRGEFRIEEYGFDTVKYWFGATDYKHNEVNVIDGVNEIGSRFKNREFESRMEISHLPMNTFLGEMRGVFGTQWGNRKLSVGGIEELLAPASVRSIAAFVFEEIAMTEKLKLQASGRLDHISVEGTGAIFPASLLPPPDDPTTFNVSRVYQPASASVGLLYALPNKITARITAQHVERAPDAIELFYKGPHDTPRTFEIGDPTMTLEKANTIEVGLKRNEGEFRFEVSAYYTQFKNFIYKNFTGAKCDGTFATCGDPNGTFDQIKYSQRDARFYGAEVQAEHDIAQIWNGTWGVSGQYDFVHATFTDGSYVPKIPPHRLGAGLYYRDTTWTAAVNLLHAFAQTNLGAFETPTSGFNLLNAELSYKQKFSGGANLVPEVTVGIRGENLLNERIRLHQSYKKDEVLQPGLNIRLFASAKLN